MAINEADLDRLERERVEAENSGWEWNRFLDRMQRNAADLLRLARAGLRAEAEVERLRRYLRAIEDHLGLMEEHIPITKADRIEWMRTLVAEALVAKAKEASGG